MMATPPSFSRVPFAKAPPNGFVPPCIPTRAPKPPAGVDRVHEITATGCRCAASTTGFVYSPGAALTGAAATLRSPHRDPVARQVVHARRRGGCLRSGPRGERKSLASVGTLVPRAAVLMVSGVGAHA
jgi:hypothetical protein